MSRCFRYSSGYARNGASSDPLIQSIKRDAEKSKDEKERKERKAERRKRKAECVVEDRGNKKQKPGSGLGWGGEPADRWPEREAAPPPERRSKKRRTTTEGGESPSLISRSKGGRPLRPNGCPRPPGPDNLKAEESELLEKSAVTEENGLPIYLLPNFTSSSGNSQVLRKRVRPLSPVASGRPFEGGSFNKIRIRMQPHGPPLCSTSGRVVGPEPEPESEPAPEPAPEPKKGVLSAGEKIRNRLNRLCGGVIAAGLPPLLPPDPDGDDWLFGGRECHGERDVDKVGCSLSSDGGPIQWPRASHLPECCVYVMPYVVPY